MIKQLSYIQMLPKNLQNHFIIFKKNTECIIRFQNLLEGAKILNLFIDNFSLEIRQELSINANILINICKITKKHQNFLI